MKEKDPELFCFGEEEKGVLTAWEQSFFLQNSAGDNKKCLLKLSGNGTFQRKKKINNEVLIRC